VRNPFSKVWIEKYLEALKIAYLKGEISRNTYYSLRREAILAWDLYRRQNEKRTT